MRYLYHGTSPLSLRRIRNKGLCGRPKNAPYWSASKVLHFTPIIWYGANYAKDIPTELTVRDDIDYDEMFHGKRSKVPGALLRLSRDDPAFDNCVILWEHHDETVFRCKKNCVKPKLEVCFIDQDTLKRSKDAGFDNNPKLANRIIQRKCQGKWKKVRYI